MSHPSPDQHDIPEEVILGVDTHKDLHVAAVVSIHGVLLDSRSFLTTAEGYRTMLDWATAFGPVRQAGVEGTHAYGAALTRHLLTAGIRVVEVNQLDKAHRRRRGKTDAIDAEAAARAVLLRDFAGTSAPAPTSTDVSPKAKPDAKRSVASNATSHGALRTHRPNPEAREPAVDCLTSIGASTLGVRTPGLTEACQWVFVRSLKCYER
ncbi:transposase [Micromonospora sp. NPDC047707]|uniref:IS110 family transposase n=1 Tax=Micromonospora sp. NPDC047707 TaxID=3154498 RepID=UPI003452CF9C